MTKIKSGALRGMSVRIPQGNRTKKAIVLRNNPTSLSEAQKRVNLELTKTAIGTRNHVGNVHYKGLEMSKPAVEIASAMAGKSFGGKSESERKADRFAASDASVRAQEAALRGK